MRRVRRFLPLVTLLLVGLALAAPGCRVGYVVRSAWYQAELLASREPVDRVLERGELSEGQRAALAVVADAKAFGERMGLQPTRNYGSVAARWDREIWTVSACDPLSFEPRTWWFPVVGRVPYLGFFKESDARRATDPLEASGLDVYRRTAGAYSTLGWFRDPILPSMLEWSEFDLADTVLHELAHATVWIPGSVAFNESFASFVGEELAFRFLEARYGADAAELAQARASFEDLEEWRRVQHQLYWDLDLLYGDATLSADEKLKRKAALFAEFPDRVAAGDFHDPEPWVQAARRGTWNNARLIQFKTYNFNRGAFEALLERRGGDVLAFMEDVRALTREARDPFGALEAAAAVAKGR